MAVSGFHYSGAALFCAYTMNDCRPIMQIGGYYKGLQAQPFRQDGREEHCRSAVSCRQLSDDII